MRWLNLFYASFDENWKVMERYARTEYGLCVTHWGQLSKAGLLRVLFCVPLSLEVRMLLS